MQFGVAMFPTQYTIGPAELARAMEERGFDLLMFPEHSHTPVSRDTQYPDNDGPLPREYSHVLDPFIALTAAAAATDRLLLATGICLVIQRDPIVLAKEVATLDVVSKGRFLFGVGGGWNREEMRDHGTLYETRWRLLRERVEAMKTLWCQDEASYHGKFVNFEQVWQWPKPVRKPHPPILVAGDGPGTLARVVRYGDAWLPPFNCAPPRFSERFAELQRLAAVAGRDRIPATIFGCSADREAVAAYADAGAEGIVFWMPPSATDDALNHLDSYIEVMQTFV
jgi:probable F420-dependent oxidoreductase